MLLAQQVHYSDGGPKGHFRLLVRRLIRSLMRVLLSPNFLFVSFTKPPRAFRGCTLPRASSCQPYLGAGYRPTWPLLALKSQASSI